MTTAEQWRSVADLMRVKAVEFDKLADDAEQRGDTLQPDLVRLLHEADGMLGLVLHRGEGAQTPRWSAEANDLIHRIRRAVHGLPSHGQAGSPAEGTENER